MKPHDQRLATAGLGAGTSRSISLSVIKLGVATLRCTSAESILQCLPTDDEVVEVQQQLIIRSLSLRQSSNQHPRGLEHKDAAIIIVLLLSYARWL